MFKYIKFIKEHKFWGKSIPDFLNWIKNKSIKHWIILDCETTGLRSDPYEVQLTQVGCIVVKYDFESNSFKEVGNFNKKIKLTEKTTELMRDPEHRIHKVLQFNHYFDDPQELNQEENVLKDLFEYISEFEKPVLVIQNAEFDMKYLNTRNSIVKFDNEVIDTKQVIQLFYLPAIQKLAENNIEYKNLINKIGISDRDNGLISSSMGKIGPALGIDMSGYHDALVDCRLTMKMLVKILDFLKENPDIDILKYQAERIKTKR